MKKLWNLIKKQKRTALLIAVIAGILLISGVWYAIAATAAFDDYELTDDNEFYVYVDQAVLTSEDKKGTAGYSVNDGWYLFFEETVEELGLIKRPGVGNYLDNWEKSVFSEGISFPLKSLGYDEGGPDAFGLTRETYRVDAGKLLDIIKERYKDDDREKLKGSITVYFAPVVTCEIYSMSNGEKPADKGKVYSYSEFDKWAETNSYYNFYPWPGATLTAVSRMYGKPVTLSLAQTPFTVRFIDMDTGEEISGYSFPAAEEYQGFALYGETLKFSSGLQGEVEGYEYVGYYWKDDVEGIKNKRTPADQKLTRKFLESGDLVLTFAFRKVKITEPPTEPPTPTPTNTPTPIPTPEPGKYYVYTKANPENAGEVTGGGSYAAGETVTVGQTSNSGYLFSSWSLSIGGTITNGQFTMPAKDVTVTANYITPTPTATPTPVPGTADDIEQSEIYYYTTDKGYYVDQAASSSRYLATRSGKNGSSVGTHTTTNRNKSYSKGTDDRGNTWYFIPDGTNATYVHPFAYGSGTTKYLVDSSEVKNITELVFPSTITSGSTTYTVTSIGGSANKYRDWDEDEDTYSTTVLSPSYSWFSYEKSTDSSYQSTDIAVQLGVIGNGAITSYGYNAVYGSNDTTQNDYIRDYNYYNTTLAEITVPDTVTRIEDCAFINCQALGRIWGGAGLAYIGESAFEGAYHLSSISSKSWKNNDNKLCYQYYYYNESCCFNDDWTAVMLEWDEVVKLGSYFYLPEEFPSMETVSKYAFRRRADLYNVVLPECLVSVGHHAFADCYLDSITIPGASTEIGGYGTYLSGVYKTLGANETSQRTLVITTAGSKAFDYARDYSTYYRLQCGYPVTYEPNGAVEAAKTFLSDIEFIPGNYVYADGSFVVEEDGTVWNLSKSEASILGTMDGGFDCCELKVSDGLDEDEEYGSISTTWILRSKNGTRWVLQIQGYEYSTGTSYYSSMSFIKHTALTAAVDMAVLDDTLYFLTGAGAVCVPYLWKDGIFRTVSGNIVFTDIYALEDGILYGISSDGKVYDILDEEDTGRPAQLDTPDGITVRKYLGSDGFTKYCVDTDGNLWAYLTVARNTKQWTRVSPAEDFSLAGEVELVKVESASYYSRIVLCDADSAEMVYIRYTSSTYTNTVSLYASASLPEGVDDAFTVRVLYDSEEYDPDIGDYVTEYTEYTYQYLFGNDGTLYYIDSKAFTDMAAGTKFSKVVVTDGGLLTLDTAGHIWSTGCNEEGHLGNPSTYGKAVSEIGLSVMKKLACVSSVRKYVDLEAGSSYSPFSVALGADGYLYGAGYGYPLGYETYYDSAEDTYKYVTLPEFTLLTHHMGGVKLLFGGTYFTGEGRVNLRDKDFLLIDKGYLFLHTVYSNFRSDGTALFTRNGYDFTGWNTAADGSGTALSAGQVIELNGPVTLYAQWKLTKNRIVYKANGGSGYMADTEQDALITSTYLKNNTYSRQGYKFTGWNTAADGSGTTYADGQYIPYFRGTLTLYAQWQFDPVDYTLKFANEIPELFTGYLSTHAMVRTYTIDGVTTNGTTVTVPAEPFSKAYTVGYDTNKRNSMSTTPVMTTVLTDAHTKAEFTFSGWKLYRDNGGSFTYLGKKYAVGEAVSDLTTKDGDTLVMFPEWGGVASYVILPVAECEGYELYGWAESATETDISRVALVDRYSGTASVYQPAKSGTLYACWEPKTYAVILNARGATSTNHTMQVTMTFDEKGADVMIPEKTGYIFHGYYTGIRGTGTRYYDETGTCVTPWTEDDKDILYAYWIQDDVGIPEEEERVEPTPLPEIEVEGTIGRTDAKALLYADDYNPTTGALDDLQPYLTYDTPSSEGAIPGTEQISFRAKMGAWMLAYKFRRISGTEYVRIYVTVPYVTQYERSEDEELVISSQQTKTYAYVVPKVWSYWEIAESGLYYPDKVTVTNEVVQSGGFYVSVDRTGSEATEVPGYEITEYGEKENHVFWEEYDADGMPVLRITLTEEQYIISEVRDTLPDIEPHLIAVCGNAAWSDTRQAEVRSDKYIFDGKTVLSDELCMGGNGADLKEDRLPAATETVEFTSYLQTYKSGIDLEERKPNGTYETTAVITYTGDSSNTGTSATKEVVLNDINDLKIHTPVACDGVVVDGIEDGILVLTDDLNFFTLRIDNTGIHRMVLGYGAKNFSFALSGKSNIAEQDRTYLNQVQFPFDVYVDVENDSRRADGSYETAGDYFVEAYTWLTMGDEEVTFYVPVTQENGSFRVEFRTIAVNCPRDSEERLRLSGFTQDRVNTEVSRYVATDVLFVEITSCLRDFVITDTNDSDAKEKLESGKQALVLKKGYGFSYELLTKRTFYGENVEIEIIPKYFWVSEDESERQEVVLYNIDGASDAEWEICCAGESVMLPEWQENQKAFLQRWSGTGMIPETVLCVAVDTLNSFHVEEYMEQQTITGAESFFKQNGYLIVHFGIKVKNDENTWYTLEDWRATRLAQDALAAGWNYVPGDVIRYDLSKSITDDYEIGGVE